jgi:hypothetical protein
MRIHNKWYDLETFDHPGGPVMLDLGKGRDATGLFEVSCHLSISTTCDGDDDILLAWSGGCYCTSDTQASLTLLLDGSRITLLHPGADLKASWPSTKQRNHAV